MPLLEFWIPDHPACSLVTVLTELSKIHSAYSNQEVWREGNIQWYEMPTKYLENLSVGSEFGVQIHGYIVIKPLLYFWPNGGNTHFNKEKNYCISQPFESNGAPLNGYYNKMVQVVTSNTTLLPAPPYCI